MKHQGLLTFVTGLCLVSGSGCKTTPDPTDTTPPTIEFTVHNLTTGVKNTYPGGGTITVHAASGDNLFVAGCATDKGGIKTITTTGNSAWSCQSGEITQQVGPGLAVLQKQELGLDKNGEAWSHYCTLQNVTLSYGCAGGFSLVEGYWVTSLTAENFAGLTASGSLTVQTP